MNGLLAAGLSTALLASAVPDDPALAGLSIPERRMLDPLRERSLQPEAILDSLGLRGDEQVADVGAGPGFFTLKLARRLPHGRVIATDIDAAALAVVERRVAAAGVTNVETRRVAPEDPGLAASSVDVAFVCQVDHYLASRADYFRALRAALKPHGRLVLVNAAKYQELDRAAAVAAGFRAVKDLAAPPGHFVMVCEQGDG